MKICAWNMENFFVFMDKYKNENLEEILNDEWEKLSFSLNTTNKHIQKVLDSAKVIKEIDSDIYILSEMGGKDSLRNFNKYFLDDNYQYLLKDGNSKRGIEIGFLVKKGLNVVVKSNNDMTLSNGNKFSRNIAELHVLDENLNVKLIVLGVHLKSKINSDGDFEGIKQRTSELMFLKDYINLLKTEKNVPVVVGGDFNSSWNDYEMNSFGLDLFEFHKLKNSSDKDSCTYVSFKIKRVMSQIDFIFCTEDIFDLNNSGTYRFKDEYGYNLGLPDSFEERKYLPSDHFPLFTKLNLK